MRIQDNNNLSFLNKFFNPVKLPSLQQQPLDDAPDEIELLGFPLCNVFELANDDLEKYIPVKEIEKQLGKEVNVLGYLITTKLYLL